MLDTRQTNNRLGQRWWTCQRCDNQYPESKVVIQKGLVICTGEGTNKCMDEYGYQYHRTKLEVPYERIPEDPPNVGWEDI